MQEFVKNPSSANLPTLPGVPSTSKGTSNRFDSLYCFTPALQASIDKVKEKEKEKAKKKKAQTKEKNPPQNPGRGGGRGGRGGRGGKDPRGGRGGRGRGRGSVTA